MSNPAGGSAPAPPVIGITGHYGAGRTSVAAFLARKHGYTSISMSDLLKNHPNEQVSTAELQKRGDRLRSDAGPSALADRALAQVASGGAKRWVVDGIKNPAEARCLSDSCDFFLLSVQARTEQRWERVRGQLNGDRNAFDDVDERDNMERDVWGVRVDHGQRVADCLPLADAVIWNDAPYLGVPDGGGQRGTLAQLEGKVARLAAIISEPGSEPPTANEIRMCQAYAVSRRSSCPQRKVGAVITNADDRILAEGWNEVPEGQPSCLASFGDCYRKKVKSEGMQKLAAVFSCRACGGSLSSDLTCEACGERHEHLLPRWHNLDYCRALHAEENAILQVSRYGGIGVENGTIYTTTLPCALCAKKIAQCGIKTVIFAEPYTVKEADDCFAKASTEVHCFEGFTHRAFERVFHVVDEEE